MTFVEPVAGGNTEQVLQLEFEFEGVGELRSVMRHQKLVEGRFLPSSVSGWQA